MKQIVIYCFFFILIGCNSKKQSFELSLCKEYKESTVGLDMLDLKVKYSDEVLFSLLPEGMKLIKGVYISNELSKLLANNKNVGLIINKVDRKETFGYEHLYDFTMEIYPKLIEQVSLKEYIKNAEGMIKNNSSERYLEYLSYKYNNQDIYCDNYNTFVENDIYVLTLRLFRKTVQKVGRTERIFKHEKGFAHVSKTRDKQILNVYILEPQAEHEIIIYAPLELEIKLHEHISLELMGSGSDGSPQVKFGTSTN